MKWMTLMLFGIAGIAAAGIAQVVYQPIAITAATVYQQSSSITAPAGTVITVTVGADTFATFTVPANQNFSGTLTLRGSAQ